VDVTGHARDTIPTGSITAVTAGAGTPVLQAPLSALTPEIFESIFSVNVRGTQLPARSAS
jgi:NAD(P)-dependent dehydrogenase (short-subunit alcohol dehydrogenase family)